MEPVEQESKGPASAKGTAVPEGDRALPTVSWLGNRALTLKVGRTTSYSVSQADQ